MKSIAFVDDEKHVLDGIRRMLRGYRKDWDMHFFESGDEALSALDSTAFDAIVSDIRMPKMNGAELLSRIKESSPGTVRIALSGYSEEEITLESLHATHQFIAKPAESNTIITSIQRAMQTQSWLSNTELKSMLSSISSLPALPEVYDQLMQEIASEDGSIQRVAGIVASDVALTAAILKIVNSAFFGLVRHIESVEQAAAVLGMDTIKNLALLTCVFSSFPSDKTLSAQRESINIRSQRLGLLVQKFAKASPLSERGRDHAQIAGMMSTVGEVITLCYRDVFASADASSPETPLIGSYLLGLWNLPYPVIEAVRWHQNPAASDIEELSPLAAVHAAWALLDSFETKGSIDLEHETVDKRYLLEVVGEEVLSEWATIANELCSSGDTVDD